MPHPLYPRARRQFFVAIRSNADRGTLLALATCCEALAPEGERVRWERWREALATGHRLKIATYSDVEVLVDDDLDTLDAARSLLGDDERFEATVPRPPDRKDGTE